jgi:hypothetical protein
MEVDEERKCRFGACLRASEKFLRVWEYLLQAKAEAEEKG